MKLEYSQNFERKKALVKSLKDFYEPGFNKFYFLKDVFPVNYSIDKSDKNGINLKEKWGNLEGMRISCLAQCPCPSRRETLNPAWVKLGKRYHAQYNKINQDFSEGKIDEEEKNKRIESALKHLQTHSALENQGKKIGYGILSKDGNWGTPNTEPFGVYRIANYLIKNHIIYGF